jgi:hypothetical protein
LTAQQNAVASAIIQEGQKRGLSRDQIVAGLNTAKLESNYGANPLSRVQQNQSGTIVQGIFQQDLGYSGDHNDPHNSAGQFFDRMIARGRPGDSAGQQAVRVQVGQYGGGYVDSQGQGGVYDRLTAPAVPPPAPPAPPSGGGRGLFGNSNIGGDGAVLPSLSNILGGGGGSARDGFSNSPIVAGPPGGGPLSIGGGQNRAIAHPDVARTAPLDPFGVRGASASGPGARPVGVPGGGSGQLGQSLDRPQPTTGGRQFGAGQSGKGFGISGGAIGTAESAAATAANLIAPGSGIAVRRAPS